MLIPDGEWFCPPCQHKLLCERLEEQLQNLDSALKKKERAERRRERLVYVGISVENIIPDGDEEEEEKSAKQKDSKKNKNLGRRSTRTRKHISYRFDDFDDAIDEAIEEDIGNLCGDVGATQGKDIGAILSEDGKESQRPIRSQARSVGNRKKRRLNDLESDSTTAESEDEFMLSNSSEDEDFGASGADDDEEDDEDAGSDVGSLDSGARPRRVLKGVRKQRLSRIQCRGRKQLRRRRRHSSEEEEEESEEEMDLDQFSDITDSDADKKRRGLRRGQHQQVNYRETSESSDNSRASTNRNMVKPRGRPRKEHLSSDYSDVSSSSRDSDDEDDYEDEEEDERRSRVNRRRREQGGFWSVREKQRKCEDDKEDGGDRDGRLKRKLSQKEKDNDKWRRRRDREEEDLEKMGRGRRREILSQQRRRRLAQMLKKRRPSTEEEEEESEESDSSSEEDRPVRKRLNRIDSDEDEEEDEEEKERRQKTKKSAVEGRPDKKFDCDAQEKRRGRSLSPSNGHRTSRVPAKPAVPKDSAASGMQGRHNGPLSPEEEGDKEEEEGQIDSLSSVQNSPQS